jgi:hypothetical protein
MRIFLPILVIVAPMIAHVYAADNKDDPTSNLPAVACRYETFQEFLPPASAARSQATPVSSYLWRESDRVETRAEGGDTGAVWERGNSGEVFFRKLYHQARKAIEYYPDDLRAAGRYPKWSAIASTFDPELLGSVLEHVGNENYMSRSAERYRGEIDGVTIEVLWLTQERLPALVIRTTANRVNIVKLAEIWPLDKAPWDRLSQAKLEQYQHLDFADLGDMESDPFVKWAIGGAHGNQH